MEDVMKVRFQLYPPLPHHCSLPFSFTLSHNALVEPLFLPCLMTQAAHTIWEWLSPAEETSGGSTVMIYPAGDSDGSWFQSCIKEKES